MSADRVIVVGAGHIGIACAHYLHAEGHDVTVVDRGSIGGACSSSNCGFIVPSHVLPLTTPNALAAGLTSVFRPRAAFRVKPQLRPALLRWMLEFARRCNRRDMLAAGATLHALLEASAAEYRGLLQDPTLDSEWQSSGMLFVFATDKGLAEFGETDSLLTSEFGLSAKHIGGDALVEFEPALLDGLAGAWFYEDDSHLRPDRLNASWATRLARDGVRFIEDCCLESVDRNGTQIAGLDTSTGHLEAEHYVFATGAWSGRLASDLDCRIPIEPGKGYSVTMTCPDAMPSRPMLMPEKHIGVTPFEDGYRIASMMEFAGFDTSIPDFRIQQLQDSARPYLRDPVGPEIVETWYGWRPMTWDSLPVVGRVPGFDNALLATGHNMLGLSLAPVTGKLIADLVAERPTDLPLEAVSPTRFN
ncbi:MAG: FAD-dependent oxidoreductase [Woeseiaceae bacterium]|nr:FAD-dependent oxidoreductase [Woeseiaceae bacterium]